MVICFGRFAARRLLGVLLGVAAATPVGAQPPPGEWLRVPGVPIDPNGARYDDIWFVDALHGWTGDSEGRIYATADGGSTWELREDLPAYVRSLAFLTAQHGFAGAVVAPGQLLQETTDGGDTFANITGRIAEPRPTGLCGLWVVDSQTVVGLGYWSDDPYFIRTTDGGLSWTSQDLSSLVDGLVDVRFFDSLTGIAVGRVTEAGASHAAVIRTEDGGDSWSLQYVSSGVAEWAWKTSFPTNDVGYVAVQSGDLTGSGAKVLKTVDGGVTWSELSMPAGYFFSGIAFIDELSGWVGGRFLHSAGMRSIAVTTDGGNTWNVLDEPLDPSVINRMRFFSFGSERIGWASGGAVYRYYPSGTPTVPLPDGADLILGAPIPNPFHSETVFPFELVRAGHVRLQVFDSLGRVVTELIDGPMDVGRHEVLWNATDAGGRPLPAGVYLYRLEAGDERRTGEAILWR